MRVSGREGARDPYANSLDFGLRAENSLGESIRRVQGAPAGSNPTLTLVACFEAIPLGSLQWLLISMGDAHTICENLAARGIPRFPWDRSIRRHPVGFRGPYGNGLVLGGP